jgi:putative ABC transport system permease protein
MIDVQNPGEHPVNDVLQPLLLILTALGGLALILSGFLVINTISGLLAQQTRQIGMMKAIGGRRDQIMALYFVMVLIYGLLALLIALPLGGLGAWGMTTYLLDFFNTDLEAFSIPTSVFAIQLAVGLLVPLLASIYPIMTGTRITVREAVSDYGVGKGQFGTGWLDRILGYFKGLSRPMLISLRNTFRRKGRLTLTLITLTLAGTTFITIFSTRDSMMATVDDMFASFGFDVLVMFERDYRAVELDRTTSQMPNIAMTENWGRATVNVVYADDETGDDITLEAPPADTEMYQPQLVEGRWLQPDDTNALVVNTDFMDDEPYLQVGDTVVLEVDGEDTTWQIVGVVQGTMAGSTVYANQPYFDDLTHNADKTRVARIMVSDELIADPDEITKIFEQQFTEAGFEVQQVMTLSRIQAVLENTFNFLIAFLLAMAVVMAAVGGLGLSGTMSMNVLERVREIGVMRAIGASDGAILRLVLVEGIIIGLLSWVAGAVVAVPLAWVIANVLGNSLLSQPLTYVYSFMGLWLWLVIAIILAAIASFFPARNASQLTVREVLAYE